MGGCDGSRLALGQLDQASRQIPVPGLLRRPSIRREAQSTSALEGTFAALNDVLAADLAVDSPRSLEITEVLNYVEAAEHAFASLADGYPITLTLLCDLHRLLVAGTRADGDQRGQLRDIQVAIGGGGSVQDARFVPPPPGLALNAQVRALVDWFNTEPCRAPHAVITAAMTLYQFETLHPFNDGNGRIGRLLIALQLLKSGLITEPLLAVSPWFEVRRDQYIDHLSELSATGRWDPWIMFFANGISASAKDTTRRVEQLLATRESYVDAARAHNLRGVARDIVDYLIGYPVETVPQLVRMTSASFPTVNNAVDRLVTMGVLESAGSNPRKFFAGAVLQALN